MYPDEVPPGAAPKAPRRAKRLLLASRPAPTEGRSGQKKVIIGLRTLLPPEPLVFFLTNNQYTGNACVFLFTPRSCFIYIFLLRL
ncbi:hypothetical protein A3A95_02505 [Candidatus Nomurabacteria bacterium RIFCSPLOWO2_01_FULL_39_18]|nr:MAG: hypothetical protein A3A95_02505 [Candidatus Nomurabacteria bacterium RIFCSPLOWO2_01_FULL_39_18]